MWRGDVPDADALLPQPGGFEGLVVLEVGLRTRIALPFLRSTTVTSGDSVWAPLPLPRMLMRPMPTTRSPRSRISGYSA